MLQLLILIYIRDNFVYHHLGFMKVGILGILMDKTMNDKMIYIRNDYKQNYLISCFFKL